MKEKRNKKGNISKILVNKKRKKNGRHLLALFEEKLIKAPPILTASGIKSEIINRGFREKKTLICRLEIRKRL